MVDAEDANADDADLLDLNATAANDVDLLRLEVESVSDTEKGEERVLDEGKAATAEPNLVDLTADEQEPILMPASINNSEVNLIALDDVEEADLLQLTDIDSNKQDTTDETGGPSLASIQVDNLVLDDAKEADLLQIENTEEIDDAPEQTNVDGDYTVFGTLQDALRRSKFWVAWQDKCN